MTNRYVKLQSDISSNSTGAEIGTISPQSGSEFVTVGFYTDQNSNIDYSIEINETTHIDPINGDNLTDQDDIVPFEVRLSESDELRALADETGGGNRTDVTVVVLGTDTAKQGD